MRCVECHAQSQASDRGWVVVLTTANEPRIVYCPDCLTALIREASGEDSPTESERPGSVTPLRP